MARFFRAPDRRQRFLLPLDMMEWLPEDDIAHLMVDVSTAQEIRSMCRSEIGARRRASGIVGLTAVTGLRPNVGC